MTKTRMIDDGTISPKVAVPTSLLALGGVILFLLDTLGVLDVDDTLWITLLSAGGITGVTGYSARPGAVIEDRAERSSWGRSESGYADPLTLLVQLVVVIIVVVLLVWLVRELL